MMMMMMMMMTIISFEYNILIRSNSSIMSHTAASALNNRVVSFVNSVNSGFDCVICMQVADDPVRCWDLCRGIFCNGCMQQALARNNSCPSCKIITTALKDVMVRSQILKHDVYCLNKGPNQSNDFDQHTSTDSRKRKAAPDDDKCTWTGKYDQLAAHPINVTTRW